jgi:eukaryotic-like serine/threonine-protein kinase
MGRRYMDPHRTGEDRSTARATSITWSPDGRYIASGSDDGTVQVWEASSGRLLHRYTGHAGSVNAVAWSPDGTQLASGSGDCTVQIRQAV